MTKAGEQAPLAGFASSASILWRSWIALSAIIAIVLTALSVLIVLQHNAVLANLIQSRLAVVAQSTSASFRPIVNLGLPLSTVRNADQILDRARALDPAITDIHVFNPTGIIVHSTAGDDRQKVSRETMLAFSLSDEQNWRTESATEFGAGFTIRNAAGETAGAIVVAYPKREFLLQTDKVSANIAIAASLLFLSLSLLALVLLRVRLGGAMRGLQRIGEIVRALGDRQQGGSAALRPQSRDPEDYGLFSSAIANLQDQLERAQKNYREASDSLERLAGSVENGTQSVDASQSNFVAAIADTPLARTFTRQLTPWIAGLVLAAVLILGYISYSEVGRSFAPQIAARTQLIGTVANTNIQRAVNSGVPIEKLVGAETFFDELLNNFPEIAYFGVSTGRIIIEAGSREKSPFAPARSRKDVPTFPITHEGEQIGYIIIDANPAYFALRFRDLLLDLGVIILVVVLLAYEIMVVMIGLSLTSPFNRLQYLAERQARGDFSKSLGTRGRNAVDRLGQFLSGRAESLHRRYARAFSSGSTPERAQLDNLAQRFQLRKWRPRLLQFSYLNDIRLPLFLFAAADELPISFLPIYTRSVDNPLSWMDLGVVLSLPLAGYLLAIVLISPVARPMAEKFGHRRLLLIAVIPTILAHLGLYASTSTLEIIAYRTLIGAGYAVATLVCQDYVLDVATREQRNRSLGQFTAAMYGGIFAGTAIGGVLADRLGPNLVFAISAVLVALSGFLVLKMMPQREGPGSSAGIRLGGAFPPIWRPLASPRFASLVFGIAIPANVLLQAFVSYLVALQLDALGASAADIARILMTYFLAIALIGPLAPRLFEGRFDPARICFAGALLSGLALGVAALWPSYWTMLAAVAGAGIGHSLVRDPQVAIAMEIAETELQRIGANPVLGALRTLERAGSIVGLVALALLSSLAGYELTIGVMSAWVLLGSALFALQSLSARRNAG